MVDSALGRRIGIMLAVTALCSAVAGCAADIGTTKSERAEGSSQLRYYGGPKYPMWSSQ
jgi:hypothetical protein